MKFLLAALFTSFISLTVRTQTAWTPVTLPLITDTISLEDMTGATTATFIPANNNATNLLPFPSGFSFQFGLTTYSQFSISAYGYIKLGGLPFTVNPTLQDTIISALYTFPNTYPTCTYKVTGVAPNRKLTIEWIGSVIGSGPVRFQLWLAERVGTIQFVYNTVKSYATGNGYAIFCKTKILGIQCIASIKTRPNRQPPLANYTAIESNNYDSIYVKSRFTFQPDTIKPIKPGNLSFANVLPGCFDVVFTDSSVNESIFRIERIDTGAFRLLANIPTTTATSQGVVYSRSETRMQPDSLYRYRVFATTGFVNSDTVYNSLRTPMPLLTGVRTVPGDYPNITALLADAECKHMGPDLVIELQNNYSYSLEPAPVRVKRQLNTRLLRNIVIRPAAGASLILSSSATLPLFTIDSVQHFGFDGRSGGTGSTINMTIRQLDSLRPAISYVYYADSGFIQYCNIEGRSRNGTYGLLYIGYQDAAWTNFPPGVNGTLIRNCKIGPASGTSNKLLVIDNNGRGDSIKIEGNEFYRFRDEAIYYNFGGTGSRFTKNRFYQPEPIGGSPLPILCKDSRGFTVIDSNKVGGSQATWGSGLWVASSGSLINCTGGLPDSRVDIQGNEFGNISGASNMINVSGSTAMIRNNKIGTSDSTNSLVNGGAITAIYFGGWGSKTVQNNFFSGLQADYPSRTANADLLMIFSPFQDSLVIRNNDFGGSNYRYSNYTGGQVRCIDLLGTRNAIIVNNEIRGFSSKNKHAFGICEEWSGTSPTEKNMIADSNRIHHLEGKLTVYGIYARIYSSKSNRFYNNEIYALRGIGPFAAIGASQPAFTGGLVVEHFPSPNYTGVADTSLVEISNNSIHSLEYYYSTAPVYLYQQTGIGVSGRRIKAYNNMVQLGIAANGQPTDSIELMITGMSVLPVIRGEVEHNSIFVGGNGEYANGIDITETNFSNGNKNMFVTNNIIQLDRVRNGSPYSNTYMTVPISPINNVVANKNIWYSQGDPNVAAKLAQWRSLCACDSSTFIADPKYINPTGDSVLQNLHLQAISPADSTGTPPVGNILRDIDNQVRLNYSPVDIGADAITPCSGNPQGITLQLNPDMEYVEICPGSTLPLSVTVTGGTVSQLQWQRNLNDISGATGSSYTVTQPGSYRVVGKLTCGRTTSRTIVVVNGVTNPVVKVFSLTQQPYCDSGRITLRAEYVSNVVSPPQIRWYKNNVLQTGRTGLVEVFDGIRLNDRYRIEVVNTLSCGTFIGKDSVVIGSVAPSYWPKLTITKFDTLRCGIPRDTIRYREINFTGWLAPQVLFVTPAPGATVEYITDSIIVINYLPPQTVQIRLYTPTLTVQCYFPDTTGIITLNYFSIAAPVATVVGNSLVSSSPVNNQWYSTPPDTPIPGATGQNFLPPANGNYFVRLIQGNCLSDKSNTINFIFTGVGQTNPPKELLQLFPNPGTDHVWIKSEVIDGPISLEIFDINGKRVQSEQFNLQRSIPHDLPLKQLLSGIYLVKVHARKNVYLFKLLITQ